MRDKIVRKMMVSYDPRKPDAKGSNFVIPLNKNGMVSLFNIKNGKPVQYGLIVFVGKSISISDILDKARVLGDLTDESINPLVGFVDSINLFKVGDVVEVNKDGHLVIVPKEKKQSLNRLPG